MYLILFRFTGFAQWATLMAFEACVETHTNNDKKTACFSANQHQQTTEPESKPNTNVHKQKTNPIKTNPIKTNPKHQSNIKLPRQQQNTRTTTGKWRTWMTLKTEYNTLQVWSSWLQWMEKNILHQLIAVLSHYLQGFHYPSWCRISYIHCWEACETNKWHERK